MVALGSIGFGYKTSGANKGRSTRHFSTYHSPKLEQRLRERAQAEGLSVAEYVERLLNAELRAEDAIQHSTEPARAIDADVKIPQPPSFPEPPFR